MLMLTFKAESTKQKQNMREIKDQVRRWC